MPYTVHLSPIDAGGFIGLGPALSGTFANITPSGATDTAAATAASPFTLAFMAATPPPPGIATLHIANSGPIGDLFRSGFVTGLPPSPGTLTVLSFPTTLTALSATAIAAMVSARVGTIALTPPGWVVGVMAALSLGTYIPLSGAIAGVVPTLNTPPGSVTFTVTGFFTFRTYYLFTDTITFTGTLVATPAPSLIGPSVGAILQTQIEAAINGAIDELVAPGLASLGFLRSPSSVVSARRVTITGSGMGLSLVLADLFGPAITPIPGNLHATVSPAPQAGSQRVYTVTVTNTATGKPISQADVTLHNFTNNGTAQTAGPLQTNASGQVSFDVALHPKIRFLVNPTDHQRERVFVHPVLNVSKAQFNTINLGLLEDPADT